jgi:hypothetical protein
MADCAREVNRAGIEEELFGEGGLAGVRMRDDGEGPTARHLASEFVRPDAGGTVLIYDHEDS